jgi:hypothetical protein
VAGARPTPGPRHPPSRAAVPGLGGPADDTGPQDCRSPPAPVPHSHSNKESKCRRKQLTIRLCPPGRTGQRDGTHTRIRVPAVASSTAPPDAYTATVPKQTDNPPGSLTHAVNRNHHENREFSKSTTRRTSGGSIPSSATALSDGRCGLTTPTGYSVFALGVNGSAVETSDGRAMKASAGSRLVGTSIGAPPA